MREARINWGVENNIYQLWHRGYVAVKGGARDCPYTFMQDLVAGSYRLPWEDEVKVTDGTSCGFPAPTRRYQPHPETAPSVRSVAAVGASNGHEPTASVRARN